MQHKLFTLRTLPLLAVILLLCSGCASFDLNKRIPWGAGEDGKPAAPMRLMAVWTDTTMTSPGKPAMRGMGGRIVFYDQANEPVKVKGTLVVYAFNETDRDPTNVTPDRKYVFLPEDFEKHYSKGRLGHSYSFWLPWDQVGGKQAAISLIARFQPDKGGEIIGEQTKHLLPGAAAELPPPQQWGTAPQTGTPGQPWQTMPGLMPGMNGTQAPGMLPPGQQQMTPAQRQQVPQETAGKGWNQQGVQQASAMMPINGAAAGGPAMGEDNSAQSKIKSYTIPLRNSNTSLVRPMDQLRAMEQQNPEQAKKMLEQQQAMFNQDGTASPAAFQAQQTYLVQQAMAQRMASEMAPAQGMPPANTATTDANGMTTSVGNTPLSGRTGSHFQQRQSKPLWGDKSAAKGSGQAGQTPGQTAESAPQESTTGSQPSRRQALGGTISRLGPAHAR